MINLIPDDIKLNNRFAIRNTKLLRYTLILAATTGAIVLISGIGVLSMQQKMGDLQAELDAQAPKLNSLKKIEVEGQKLSERIIAVDQLLEKQVTFSTLLPKMASLLPPGAILKNIEFSTADLNAPVAKPATPATGSTGTSTAPPAKTLEKPFHIQAAVRERSIAATLFENIVADQTIFERAELIDVSFSAPSGSDDSSVLNRYPYQVTINAYFKKGGTKKTSSIEQLMLFPKLVTNSEPRI